MNAPFDGFVESIDMINLCFFIVLVGDFLLDVCLENAQIKRIYAFKSGAGDSTLFTRVHFIFALWVW
ncbi:hypothetical protein DDN51_03605 [Vibrio cholerae]|nr:hypothetical protein [Vibrio cholerae]